MLHPAGPKPWRILQVERLLKQIDLNSDDGIAYDEWMAAMLTWRSVRPLSAAVLH